MLKGVNEYGGRRLCIKCLKALSRSVLLCRAACVLKEGVCGCKGVDCMGMCARRFPLFYSNISQSYFVQPYLMLNRL